MKLENYKRTLEDDKEEFNEHLISIYSLTLKNDETELISYCHENIPKIMEQFLNWKYQEEFTKWAADMDENYPRYQCPNCAEIYDDEDMTCCEKCAYCETAYPIDDMTSCYNGYVCDECKFSFHIDYGDPDCMTLAHNDKEG